VTLRPVALVSVAVGVAAFTAWPATDGLTFAIAAVACPLVVLAVARRRDACGAAALTLGAASLVGLVATWAACLLVVLVIGILGGGTPF
jgi:hypothetical protein